MNKIKYDNAGLIVGNYCRLKFSNIEHVEKHNVVFLDFNLNGRFALSKDEYEKLVKNKNPKIEDVAIKFIESEIEKYKGK